MSILPFLIGNAELQPNRGTRASQHRESVEGVEGVVCVRRGGVLTATFLLVALCSALLADRFLTRSAGRKSLLFAVRWVSNGESGEEGCLSLIYRRVYSCLSTLGDHQCGFPEALPFFFSEDTAAESWPPLSGGHDSCTLCSKNERGRRRAFSGCLTAGVGQREKERETWGAGGRAHFFVVHRPPGRASMDAMRRDHPI
ncbi:hypothetical protein VTO42DRAFT_1590 [Malbranchea cinnamomea]